MARAEFAQGFVAAGERMALAALDQFTTKMPSSAAIETHFFVEGLPRLTEFKGYSPAVNLTSKEYLIANKTYRAGPVQVKKENLDDDQFGMFLKTINGLPARAQQDVYDRALKFLAAGTTNTCFDGTALFANNHTVGSGDNLDTFNAAASDGSSHKIIALRTDNPICKPLIFQDREAMSALQTDADTPQAAKLRQYEYWADCRFGLGYGYWWDAYHVTISDKPTVGECYDIIEQIINGMKSFTLPKGKDTDDSLYVHEGWRPNPSNFVLLCNLKLENILDKAMKISQFVTSTGNVDNVYRDYATVIGTSALGV